MIYANGPQCGCPYYIRALIYYRLGQPDLALADIEYGTGLTWERGGPRLYVLALLALDGGDKDVGLQLLQEAETSLPRKYGPVILRQIRDDMTKYGVSRLEPTAYVEWVVTPMPTPP